MAQQAPLVTKPLREMLSRIVNHVLDDCETIFRVWDEQKDWLEYDIAAKRNHCGGGHFIVVQGLISTLNLMAKTYDRLEHGDRNFKHSKTLGGCTVRTEIRDEGQAFEQLVDACHPFINLGIESTHAKEIWQTFRHPLVHFASPHYPIRIEGSDFAFDWTEKQGWICTARSLHRDVRQMLQWLWKRVGHQSQDRINDVQKWLEVENDPAAQWIDEAKPTRVQGTELSLAAAELAFEFTHFRLYRSELELRNGSMPTLHRQAMLYSLLLGMRLILGFFSQDPRGDDVSIKQFMKMAPGFKKRFDKKIIANLDSSREIVNHLHKRLAHVTATRWRQKTKQWSAYAEHFDAIEAAIVEFEKALSPDLRAAYDAGVSRWSQS